MALIECTECGAEVSEKAKKCPNCGAPLKRGFVKSYIGFFLLLLGLAAICSVLFEGSFGYYDIKGTIDFLSDNADYSYAYVGLGDTFYGGIVILTFGLILLWFAKKKLLPDLSNLYYVILVVVCGCFIGSYMQEDKSLKESWLERYKYEQREKEESKRKTEEIINDLNHEMRMDWLRNPPHKR